MVRFERTDDAWEVHYSVAQPFRRRGLARHVLAAALIDLRSHDANALVFGQVKESNQSSRRVFESLGFTKSAQSRDHVITYEARIDSFKQSPDSLPARLHANR
jgi:RimJ/RimL family protein N-acetyltransferase